MRVDDNRDDMILRVSHIFYTVSQHNNYYIDVHSDKKNHSKFIHKLC